MTPVRKQRLVIVGLVLSAAVAAGGLLTLALQQNISYLHSPSEVLEGRINGQTQFKLGGVVQEGSVARKAGTMEVRFEVTDRNANFPVVYNGILPDLFREGQSVIARGRLEGDHFVAEEVLAKHDETYMPAEVADKMAAATAAKAEKAKASGGSTGDSR
ncbi:MAG: cytochrome c maturation protein CcmE [Pseudomarimonas sp.]